MVLFIVGNLLSARRAAYGLMMVGRVVAALRARRVLRRRLGRRRRPGGPARRPAPIALMFTGLTAANVLGVPMGTALGQTFGWRVDVLGVTVLGVIGLARHRRAGARTSRDPRARTCATSSPRFRSGQVWLAMLMTVLGFGGVFAAFTYIAPMMTEVAGFGDRVRDLAAGALRDRPGDRQPRRRHGSRTGR